MPNQLGSLLGSVFLDAIMVIKMFKTILFLIYTFPNTSLAISGIDNLSSTTNSHDLFGQSIGLSGDNLIVGVPNDDIGFALERGSSIIYNIKNPITIIEHPILAFDGQEGDLFGFSVDISGETAVIGAPFDDIGLNQNVGAAYIFSIIDNVWMNVSKLSSDNAIFPEGYGEVVAVDNDTIVVSAPKDREGGLVLGAIYVYRLNGNEWVLEQKIPNPEVGNDDDFGRSISLVNNTLFIGAPGDEEPFGPANEGSVYVYLRSGTVWLESFKINPINSLNLSGFGRSVSSTEEIVVIGVFDPSAGESAYIYMKDQVWIGTL